MTSVTRLLLKGGQVYTHGDWLDRDVLIHDGAVTVGRDFSISDLSTDGVSVIDIKGKYILPGLVDVHVHLRQPGFSYKETIASGSLAGAYAGYTALCAMPNLNPAPDSVETLSLEQEIIDRDAVINVYPYACITKGEKGAELVDFASLKGKAIAFSDDGKGVQSAEIMEKAMMEAAKHDILLAAHCEDESLIHGGYIHDGTYAASHGHKGICRESEYAPIIRDALLAEKTGCRYHVCHVSTAQSVEAIRSAKARGVKITAETAPHYLVLTDNDLCEDGRFKMNPPLRSEIDRKALIDGINDGTIDIIATDHAPHSAEEKGKGLEHSAFGITGLETALTVMYTKLALPGIIAFERIIECMTDAPRRIFGIPGGIENGDIAVFDPGIKHIINPESFVSMGKSTPFADWEVLGRNVLTLCGGKKVFEIQSAGKEWS